MSRLSGQAWPELADRAADDAVLVVPIGATEQHGPHLPVTTDTDIARAVVDAAAALDRRVVVAPAVPYGSSGEHDGFAGTISLGQEATEALLVELGRSATRMFAHVVLACTHGGNGAPLTRALTRLVEEGHAVSGWWPRWAGDPHAGRTETSLMLAIAPDRVRLDRAEAGDLRPVAELLPLLRAGGVRSVSPNGVLGDPAGANPEEGSTMIRSAAADLIATIAGARQSPTGQEIPR